MGNKFDTTKKKRRTCMDIMDIIGECMNTLKQIPSSKLPNGKFADTGEFLSWLETEKDKLDNCLVSVWTPEDVRGLRGCEDFTDEEAGEVFQIAEHRFDACRGHNWDTLQDAAESVISRR